MMWVGGLYLSTLGLVLRIMPNIEVTDKRRTLFIPACPPAGADCTFGGIQINQLPTYLPTYLTYLTYQSYTGLLLLLLPSLSFSLTLIIHDTVSFFLRVLLLFIPSSNTHSRYPSQQYPQTKPSRAGQTAATKSLISSLNLQDHFLLLYHPSFLPLWQRRQHAFLAR